MLGSVALSVLQDAFSFKCGVGGVSAFLLSKSIKEGFLRALLSNEAGSGTSSMAESQSNSSSGAAGVLGMGEVFFDTVLLCTLTALAVL